MGRGVSVITHARVLVLVGLLTAVVALIARGAGWLGGLERAAVNARFAIRGWERAPSDIAIVAIDQNSLAKLSQWPFPRTLYPPVIHRLHADGAKAIAFDIEFNRPTNTAADNALIDATAAARPVVFATSLIDERGRTEVLGGPLVQHQIGALVGATLAPSDSTGTVRRVPYAVRGLPSFAVVLDRFVGGHRPRPAEFGHGGELLDYLGPAGTVSTVSFLDVLKGRVPPAAFSGKIVIIGETAPSGQDLHPSPFGLLPGAEVQATALATIRRGFPLGDASGGLNTALIVLLALLAPAVSARWGTRATLGAAVIGVVGLSVGSQLAFDAGTILDYSDSLLAVSLATGATVAVGYVAASRERGRLRELFAAFSPEVVDQVLGDSSQRGRMSGPTLPATGVIGGYRMQEVVGRGAMGVVYKATQLTLGRPVAIKVISPEHGASRRFRERFEREARLAASVEHPNVIPVYGAGDDDGLLYIAMRYVDGIDLGALVARLGPLAPLRAAGIIGQVGGALDAAHACGLVHRDVKPGNILLTLDEPEHAYLTDFGVAKTTAPGEQTALTRPGTFVGTIDYIAPEQLHGDAIDGRADQYALGCVLYELLTAVVPFPLENDLAKLYAHANAMPPRPSELDPGLAAFDPVIARAIAKEPTARFADCAGLAAAAGAAAKAAATLGAQKSR